MILFWLLPLIVLLHIVEEFLFPGGFRRWYQSYRPEIASSLTVRFLVTINVILIVVSILPILMGTTPYAVAFWLTIVAILFSNALFHIMAGINAKAYNPGLISSLLLYLPLSIFGYWYFVSTAQASLETAGISFILGASYQWWSLYNHKRRSQAEETNL